MNKSDTLKTIERILTFFPLIFVMPFPGTIRIIILVCWLIAVFIYLYPSILTYLALVNYEKKGQDFFLKNMSLAYKSGRLNPKSAATYSFVLLKSGALEEASEVLDYAEMAAFERKNRRKGEMIYNHVHSYRALIFWKQDRLNDAVSILQNLLDEGYKTTVLFSNLGWFLIEQRKYTEALKVNLEALEYDRANGILDNLALNYFKLGDLEKSRELYKELIDRQPEFPDAWFNYGKLLEADGDYSKARDMYRKALSCNFSFLGTISKKDIQQALR